MNQFAKKDFYPIKNLAFRDQSRESQTMFEFSFYQFFPLKNISKDLVKKMWILKYYLGRSKFTLKPNSWSEYVLFLANKLNRWRIYGRPSRSKLEA